VKCECEVLEFARGLFKSSVPVWIQQSNDENLNDAVDILDYFNDEHVQNVTVGKFDYQSSIGATLWKKKLFDKSL